MYIHALHVLDFINLYVFSIYTFVRWLLFTCYLCPKDGRAPKNSHYRLGPDDIQYHMVFFSTFEELKLPITWPMERAGVTSCMSPPLHPAFMWHQPPAWWAEFH